MSTHTGSNTSPRQTNHVAMKTPPFQEAVDDVVGKLTATAGEVFPFRIPVSSLASTTSATSNLALFIYGASLADVLMCLAA